MKKFVLKRNQETLAVVKSGAMLFLNPQPFLPEVCFTYSLESHEEDYARTLSRKKGNKDINSSGKYVGYQRKPRNGFGRPNTPFPIQNKE